MDRHFGKWFAGIVGVKLLLAYYFPITSDEAYFYAWAHQLDFNYYDHPPMTGWAVYLLAHLGRHVFFPRLFSVIAGVVVAGGIYKWTRQLGGNVVRARFCALLYLLSPMHLLFVIIATDTPLLLFVFLSGYLLHNGIRRGKSGLVFFSGLCWGGAILSKYFAGLFLIAYSVYVLDRGVLRREKKVLRHAAVWLAGAVPPAVLHIYWNYQHCWTNLMFNVINRNRGADFSFGTFIVFLCFQIYLATPWVLLYLYRGAAAVRQGIRRTDPLPLYLFTVPILIFSIVAFHHTGLHWTMAFYPFLFLLVVYLDADRIRRLTLYSAIFSLLHLIPVFCVLALPVETFKGAPYYHDLVLSLHGDEIYRVLKEKYGQAQAMATNGYYTSGAMTYHSDRRFIVFLDDSKHGRQDDRLTDFRKLDGKDIAVFSTLPIEEDYQPYFQHLIHDRFVVRGQTFYVAFGEGFRYRVYRDRFLTRIRDRFYTIPDILPMGRCFFLEKYFPEDCGGSCGGRKVMQQ